MASFARLKEFEEVLTQPGIDPSIIESGLDELISALPVLNVHRDLREQSARLVSRLPIDIVSKKLGDFANEKLKVHASDIGLVLRWVDCSCSVNDPSSEVIDSLLLTDGKLLAKAILAVGEATSKNKRRRSRFISCAEETMGLLAYKFRDSYDIRHFIEQKLSTEQQSIGNLALSALLVWVFNGYSHPNFTAQLTNTDRETIMKLWCSVILSAKPQVFTEEVAPVLESGLLNVFWTGSFVTQDIFDSVVVPALQKALLRAPEGVVTYVLPTLLSNQELVMDKLVEISSLTSNLTSSNQDLRVATAKVFGSLLAHTKEPNLSSTLLAQFKKVTNSEQRALFASVVKNVRNNYDEVSQVLCAQIAKESSETHIPALADAVIALVPHSSVAVEGTKRGLLEPRKPLRREWILALAAAAAAAAAPPTSATTATFEQFSGELEKTWKEITDNVSAAASAKLASAGYGLVLLLKNVSSVCQPLFGPRVYEHLSSDRELDILNKACISLLEARTDGDANSAVLPALAHSVMHGSIKQQVANLLALKHAFAKCATSENLTKDFVRVLRDIAHTKQVNVSKIVSHITTKQWLLDAFVLFHEPLAAPSRGWIQCCLSASVDPHDLVASNADSLFADSVDHKNVDALATLAFVAPDVIATKIDHYLLEHLHGSPMSDLDVAILETPEGQLASLKAPVVQSRSKKNGNQSDEAWEAELRKEIAQKHGKLTPEQQAELKEQTERRQVLTESASRVEFCCALLSRLAHDLAQGAENGSIQWIPDGINLCLDVVNNRVTGRDSAVQCLSSLSVCLSDRFKGHWKMVASKLLLQGSKVDLNAVKNMLYMLNPLSDKRLLDSSTLVYILPILRTVISQYDGSVENEDADETILLITSLIANQAEVLAIIPRGDLVQVLLVLLGQFAADRGAVKDCLRRLAQRVQFGENELHMLFDASVAAPQDFVRGAALEVIDSEVDLEGHAFAPEIWISRFGQFAEVAQDIWSESRMTLPESEALNKLVPFFDQKYVVVRDALAKAFVAAALATHTELSVALTTLQNLYIDKKRPPTPKKNNFGLEIKQKWVDPVPQRLSILLAMKYLVIHLKAEDVTECAKFIVDEGVTDQSTEASAAALEVGKTLIDEHGKDCVDSLLSVFENRDIVLFGFAAQHLPTSDPRLSSTVEKLLAALPTSTDQNRGVIVESLGPLAKRIDHQQSIIEQTLDTVFSGQTTEERRGAAFGFAGIARGVGISTLGDTSIVNAVSGGVEDRKDAGRREGAQLLVIALSKVFGRMFEPYAIELMPQVLIGLGDVNPIVREAATEAARSIMANTTSFGIKKQIPLALDQLDTTAWRGKKGAVELLGSMAYLSPQQLATSLALIVPEIVALLNDTHKEVRSAAQRSMKMFGDVIQNPEIHKLVPTLLAAISDPTTKTDSALTDLLKTRFMHYIDSPSLALIIFVVQRGLRDRSANTKKKACQIVGNMSILTAGRDLVPYLPSIMPDLQVAMTDPVPQTCAVACKALGVLVEKLGEEYFPNVIPDMISTLQSDDPKSIGSRWGTAQGLAEVLHGLGTAKLDELLPEIVASCQSPIPHIRQGFVPLLLLLPGSFGASLTPYLSQLIPPLLSGLADQLDDVRDNALKAGRRIVRGYATIAVDLLLPELETGLWSPNWRIRLASVELVGDLLMELLGKGGVTANDRLKALAVAPPTEEGELAEVDQQETDKTLEAADNAENAENDKQTEKYVEANLRNLEVLGVERRDRVLSSIFICRADVVAAVRQVALDTWLAIIQNTPRAVKLILPTLILMLLRRLGDDDDELQTNAARALAEVVRRVSGALKLILPTFLEHLSDRDARQGICLGLVELIPATPAQSLQEHERELMHLVRTCLQDSNNSVREAATRALDELHSSLGDIAGDMLPDMVDQIVTQNDEGALAAIKEMLASSGAGSVLSAVIPALLKSNLDSFKSNAIAELCETATAGDIHMYVDEIVDRLISTPYSDALDSILAKSCPEAHLLTIAKNDEQLRARVFERMAVYYSQPTAKLDPLFVSDWIVFGLHGLEEESTSDAAESLIRAISSSATLGKNELAKLSTVTYHTLQLLATPIKAFARAEKGPAFILPFFLHGLTAGSNAEKEQSALGIAEVVRRTDPVDKLKPVITQITGPLIRIVGERTPADVKAAIIFTLNVLLTTIPAFLKPFLPQLQRTFAKNLADQSSVVVRTRSAMALGSLIKLQTRIDPLTKEIIIGVRSAPDAGVRSAFLTALHEIVCHAGQHLGDAVKQSVIELIGESEPILESDNSSNDVKQLALFARIGADVIAISSEDESPKKLVESLISRKSKIQSVLNGNALYMHAPKIAGSFGNELASLFQDAANKPDALFSENGVSGLGKLLLNDSSSSTGGKLKPFEESSVRTLVSLVPQSDDRPTESRRLALLIIGALCAHHKTATVIQPFLDDLVVPLFTAARDRNIPVKIAAERTFLAIFDFVGRHDSTLFDEWFEKAKDGLDTRLQRALPEYVRRVAMRAATRETSTDIEDDAIDDMSEIWAVGLE